MNHPVILDSGPLGQISHADPSRHAEIKDWFDLLLARGIPVFISAIADFEVRRSLILAQRTRSLARLDALQNQAAFLPIANPELRLAARLWAMARKHGRPVGDPKELNADVILAAQAISIADAVIATDNVGHLGQFVDARPWRSILP
jgi:predicted nucleic acid-binding protein